MSSLSPLWVLRAIMGRNLLISEDKLPALPPHTAHISLLLNKFIKLCVSLIAYFYQNHLNSLLINKQDQKLATWGQKLQNHLVPKFSLQNRIKAYFFLLKGDLGMALRCKISRMNESDVPWLYGSKRPEFVVIFLL